MGWHGGQHCLGGVNLIGTLIGAHIERSAVESKRVESGRTERRRARNIKEYTYSPRQPRTNKHQWARASAHRCRTSSRSLSRRSCLSRRPEA